MEIMIPVWVEAAVIPIQNKYLTSLSSSRIALLDDNLDEPFTSHVEKLLSEIHGAVVQRLVKPLGSAPSPKALIEEAARSEVAICGIGL